MKRAKSCPIPKPETLESLPISELKKRYETLLQAQPPAHCGPDFLKGSILWALQAIEAKSRPKALRQSLLKLTANAKIADANYIKPGTRLVREWHGNTYEVTVLDTGYLWKNKTYGSLSRIACEITGTHLSGPKFFGLAKKR